MENTSCSLKKTIKGGKQMIFKYLINSTAKYTNLEEVMEKLKYVDKRTLKEKEKQYKECAKIAAKNKKIYKMLFGK